MKRVYLSLLLVFLFLNGEAQNFFITAFAGAANYQGDLQENRYTFSQAHFAYGLGLKYEITDRLSARANISIGKISADDKQSSRQEIRDRNLNFSSSLTDIHLGIEYDIFNLYENKFTPYIFTGISAYHFNPYSYDSTGAKVYLQPLGTEGQGFYLGRKKYSLNQIAVPIGGGLKIAVSDNVRIGVEIGLRKLFTDYLDDVSATFADNEGLLLNNGPKAVELSYREDELKNGVNYPPANWVRGNPKSKDWYYFSGLMVSFRIGDGLLQSGSGGGKKYGCPANIY